MDRDTDDVQPTQPTRGGRRQASQDTERLNVQISATMMRVLRDIAQSNDVTLTEAIRRAISLLKLVDEAVRAGEEIQIVDQKTNKTRVLHLI